MISDRSQLMSLIFANRKKSGKIGVVEKMLEEWFISGKKDKVLIFTQSKMMLDLFEMILNEHGMKFCRIDGSVNVKSRMSIIDSFSNDPDCFALLLTTRVGGLGLNLMAANKVIIIDPDWNPMVDLQASDRAARIG